MEFFEHIFEVSTKLEPIQEFYEFCEDIHKIAKYSDEKRLIGIFIKSLKDVFDSEKGYYFRVNSLIKKSVEYYKVLMLCFNYRKLVKKN